MRARTPGKVRWPENSIRKRAPTPGKAPFTGATAQKMNTEKNRRSLAKAFTGFLACACPASRKLLAGESPVRVSAKALGSYQTTGEEILRLKLCDKVPTKVGQASHQVAT